MANPISFGQEGGDQTPRKSVNFQRNSALISSENNQRKSFLQQPGSATVGRQTLAATRVSVFGADNARKSILDAGDRKSILDQDRSGRNSFIGLSAQVSSKTSQFTTRNHSPQSGKKGNFVDDHEYTTAMRYGKIPERGGAKNPYSENNPFPKPEITSEKLRPGYREEWLNSLESKFVPKQTDSGHRRKSAERIEQRKSVLATPIKDADDFFGEKSTAIKTSTVKRTSTFNTKEIPDARDNKPRTSKFDIGIYNTKTVTESQVVSNKVY